MLLKPLYFLVLALFVYRPFSAHAQAVDSCLAANVDRYLWVTDTLSFAENKDLKTRLEMAEKVFAVKKKDPGLFDGPWANGLVATLGAQKVALQNAIDAIHSPNIKNIKDVKSFLRRERSSGGSGYISLIRTLVKGFNSSGEDAKRILGPRPVTKILEETQDEDFLREVQNSAGIVATCAKMSLIDSVQCSKAVSLVLRESRWSGANILFPKIWLEAFKSKIFQEGLRKLALKQIDRIENKEAGNITTDAVAAFVESGAKSDQAEDYTWKTLALYGNGGHNTGLRALLYDLSEQDMITSVSLSIIGVATTLIDFEQRLNGKSHYALPKETVGSCLSPKPYHFWMNAFISRFLIQSGFSPSISSMASFTVSKGYHLNRQMNNTGSGVEKVFTKPANHPTSRVIKMDLTLNASGALYGSGQLRRDLNFSNGLQILIDRTKTFAGLPTEQAVEISGNKLKAFNLWHEVFQPDFIFEYFKN